MYLLNHLTKTALWSMSPCECVYGAAPDLKWLQIWVWECYAISQRRINEKASIKSILKILDAIFYTKYRVFGFRAFPR